MTNFYLYVGMCQGFILSTLLLSVVLEDLSCDYWVTPVRVVVWRWSDADPNRDVRIEAELRRWGEERW